MKALLLMFNDRLNSSHELGECNIGPREQLILPLILWWGCSRKCVGDGDISMTVVSKDSQAPVVGLHER